MPAASPRAPTGSPSTGVDFGSVKRKRTVSCERLTRSPSVIFCRNCGMRPKRSVCKGLRKPCNHEPARDFTLKRLKKGKYPYWVPDVDAAFQKRDKRVDKQNGNLPVGDPRRMAD